MDDNATMAFNDKSRIETAGGFSNEISLVHESKRAAFSRLAQRSEDFTRTLFDARIDGFGYIEMTRRKES